MKMVDTFRTNARLSATFTDTDPDLKPTAIFMLCVWIVLILAVFRYVPIHPLKINPPVSGYELNGFIDNGYIWGRIR